MKTLRCSSTTCDYENCIVVDKIAYLNKSQDGDITFIHLINGETISSFDSINTLEARINKE